MKKIKKFYVICDLIYIVRFHFGSLLEALDEKIVVKIEFGQRKIETYISLDEVVDNEIKRLVGTNTKFELQFYDGWTLDSTRTFRQNSVFYDRHLRLIEKL